MYENINILEAIEERLESQIDCHVVICEDSQKMVTLAINYAKKLRQKIIREKRDREEGFWNLYLSDGYKFVFCTPDYFSESNLKYSCLSFSK